MRSVQSSRITYDEKIEIMNLYRENALLRNQLKEIGIKLNEIIEKQEIEKKLKKLPRIQDHAEQLKEANKIIETCE